MDFRKNALEAQARRKARRDRDDSSARLVSCVPAIAELRIEIEVSKNGAALQAARHVRRFVVDSAPAVFVVECTDPDCRGGGHDLTAQVLSGLTAGKERFVAEQTCQGKANDQRCDRVMSATVVARYDARRGRSR